MGRDPNTGRFCAQVKNLSARPVCSVSKALGFARVELSICLLFVARACLRLLVRELVCLSQKLSGRILNSTVMCGWESRSKKRFLPHGASILETEVPV